jgi:hypothetical protein
VTNHRRRRAIAATVAALLVVLVACDISITGFSGWWDRHALTASVASNLMVLGVAGLIVDEVVARRQRRERGTSVAVQALILYAQARRSYNALLAVASGEEARAEASDEMRMLASMLLTASTSLFDDPQARVFLEQVQRLGAEMYRTVARSEAGIAADDRTRLATAIAAVDATTGDLIARLPGEYRSNVEEPD